MRSPRVWRLSTEHSALNTLDEHTERSLEETRAELEI